MPLATVQFAGEWSCAMTHWFRSLPLKRMIASEGGALSVAPGVTTGGTGCQTSVSSGFAVVACCAAASAAQQARTRVAIAREDVIVG